MYDEAKVQKQGAWIQIQAEALRQEAWDETVEVVDALESSVKRCICLPLMKVRSTLEGAAAAFPEDDDELETWGCAPADYTACAYAPTDEAGCESHGDKTGDLVCAWDSTANQCIGCTSVTDEAGCAAT